MQEQSKNIALALDGWAIEKPDQICLIDENVLLSRKELFEWAKSVSRVIAKYLPQTTDATYLIAMILPRSWSVPASIWAIRKASCAFLPLDRNAVMARIEQTINISHPWALLVQATDQGYFEPLVMGAKCIEIQAPHPELENLVLIISPLYRSYSKDVGHVIFTSGSTGTPKGVLLRDQPLLETAWAQRQILNINGTSSKSPSLWAINPAFDASLSDIFTAWLGESPLLCMREKVTNVKKLKRLIDKFSVERADLPPSLLRVLEPQNYPLKALIFGGEPISAEAAKKWGQACNAWSAYGPTEAAVCAMIARVDEEWQPCLLGVPLQGKEIFLHTSEGILHVLAENYLQNNRVILRTAEGKRVTSPVEGEIWIGASSIAIGYLDNREAEESRFPTVDGCRFHATRDQATWDGKYLIWRGRSDRQIKRLGKMVCPEEIETVLDREGGVKSYCFESEGNLILAVEAGTLTNIVIKDIIRSQLGVSFLPNRIVPILNWPLNSNEKTAVQSLKEIVRDQEHG